MADEVYVLSRSDKDFLQSLYQRYTSQINNRQVGIAKSLEDTQQNIDIYIARVSSGGIPGLAEGDSATGTGSGITDDAPGEATCDIYTLKLADGVVRLKPVTGLTKKVYNISTSSVAENSWILVTKEKFGFWIVVNPSGGTGGGDCNLLSPTGTIGPYLTYASISHNLSAICNEDGTVTIGGSITLVTTSKSQVLTVTACEAAITLPAPS